MTLRFDAQGLCGEAIVGDRAFGPAHIRSQAQPSIMPGWPSSNSASCDGARHRVTEASLAHPQSAFWDGTALADALRPTSDGDIALLLRSESRSSVREWARVGQERRQEVKE
jgi:hypothetical protein